jgi:hypothetical protein
MSTRANIAVILKKSDIGQELISPENENNSIVPTKPVLRVYVHNDGYVEDLGESLYRDFPEDDPETYDILLGYIMEGDRSTYEDAYHSMRGEVAEPWRRVQPKQFDMPKDWLDIADQDYLYVYDPEQFKWYAACSCNGKVATLGQAIDDGALNDDKD